MTLGDDEFDWHDEERPPLWPFVLFSAAAVVCLILVYVYAERI